MSDIKNALVKAQQQRAIKVDLIEIPDSIKERCNNCIYISSSGFCKNKEVNQQIKHPDQACCGLWDNPAVDRSETQGKK